ncbi:hypothetical protein ACNHUS_19190 [Actinomycetes bacterium M1A6_2h]
MTGIDKNGQLVRWGMETTTKPTGLAGPIVLLYLGYVASVPYAAAVLGNVGNPDVSFEGVLPFGLLALVGFAAVISAIRMLAENDRFRGMSADRSSSSRQKLMAVTVTAVVLIFVVWSLAGGPSGLGIITPLALAWSAANAMRLHRSLR